MLKDVLLRKKPLHTASCLQFQNKIYKHVVVTQHNWEINKLLLLYYSFRRTRPRLCEGRSVFPELPEPGKALAGGIQTLAPADSNPPCHSTTWQILNFGFVHRTFTFLKKERWQSLKAALHSILAVPNILASTEGNGAVPTIPRWTLGHVYRCGALHSSPKWRLSTPGG